jgi:hypothetical protein
VSIFSSYLIDLESRKATKQVLLAFSFFSCGISLLFFNLFCQQREQVFIKGQEIAGIKG